VKAMPMNATKATTATATRRSHAMGEAARMLFMGTVVTPRA